VLASGTNDTLHLVQAMQENEPGPMEANLAEEGTDWKESAFGD